MVIQILIISVVIEMGVFDCKEETVRRRRRRRGKKRDVPDRFITQSGWMWIKNAMSCARETWICGTWIRSSCDGTIHRRRLIGRPSRSQKRLTALISPSEKETTRYRLFYVDWVSIFSFFFFFSLFPVSTGIHQ